jgi:hypothetical protein
MNIKNAEIISEIKNIYEKHVLKDVKTFCVNDYNEFETEIWALKEKYNLKDSPFLLLPNPAEEADREMMNASNDGLTEPDDNAKKSYLEKMKISYEKL